MQGIGVGLLGSHWLGVPLDLSRSDLHRRLDIADVESLLRPVHRGRNADALRVANEIDQIPMIASLKVSPLPRSIAVQEYAEASALLAVYVADLKAAVLDDTVREQLRTQDRGMLCEFNLECCDFHHFTPVSILMSRSVRK